MARAALAVVLSAVVARSAEHVVVFGVDGLAASAVDAEVPRTCGN